MNALPEPLTSAGVSGREAEVLWQIAARLRNREIADRLHLSVRTVESHVAALLRKLGVPDRAALADLGAVLRRVDRPATALPRPLTTMVGRDDATREIAALLTRHRLVTLVGPGGVGKTRLAIHVATLHRDRFADGVRLADLAPATPRTVGDIVARALGLTPEPGDDPREALRAAAGGLGELLLVLDNCEHVISEAAAVVDDLLHSDAPTRIVATSRESLAVPGEVLVPVRPLPVPESVSGADDAAAYAAVRLFVDRAATASPDFALSDANASAVASVCRRLDGLPLAIELAAARLPTFGPAELLEHLDRRFALLSAGARTAPSRHRTLRDAIDWSYALLDPDERALFDRLGVFPAEFDFAAAEAVCPAAERGAVLVVLPRLVDKSLVVAVGADRRRYRLWESVKVYAGERLAESTDATAVHSRHRDHYLALAEGAVARLGTPEQRQWLDHLAADQPNLHAALGHAIDTGDAQTAWRFIAALQRYWDGTGQRRQAYEWVRRTLAIGPPAATPVSVAGLAAASAILQPSDTRTALDLADRATDLATDLDDHSQALAARAVAMSAVWLRPELVRPALDRALAKFGEHDLWDRALTLQWLLSTRGDLDEALRWGRDSVALFRTVGDQSYAANTLFMMAQRKLYSGVADEEVHGWLTESRQLADAVGSEGDITHATVGFAQYAWASGDHARAVDLMRDCLPALRRLGDRRCTGRALYLLGEHARQEGDLEVAEQHLRGSIDAITRAGQAYILISALEALAAVLSARHRPRSAAVLLGAADHAREGTDTYQRPVSPPDDQLHKALLDCLGSAAFQEAYQKGKQRPLGDALRHTASEAAEQK